MKALVTGAAREGGIGRAIVARLQADGMDVVTIDKEPGCSYRADLAYDPLPELGDIDVLVCNAGLTTMFGTAHEMPLERWQRDLDANLTGTLRTVQACLPGMRERRYGRVVFISAGGAFWGLPGHVAYATSKAALRGMSRTVAAEGVALGITANVVIPGMTASSGVLALPQEVRDAWLATMPMGEFAQPEDVAEAVAFFASPAARRITGQELTVDAGDRLNTKSVTGSVAAT